MSPALQLNLLILLTQPPETSSGSASDGELIQWVVRARQGEDEALSYLIERFRRPIGRYVYTLILDRSAMEDVAQDVFIKMVRGLSGLRQPETFGAWLFSLARHSSLDYLRRQRFRRFWAPLSDAGLEEVADERDDEQSRRFAETFEHALKDFSPRDRELLALALQGHSYEEIAALQRVSHGSVKGRLCRVREHLRAAMAKADSIPPHAR